MDNILCVTEEEHPRPIFEHEHIENLREWQRVCLNTFTNVDQKKTINVICDYRGRTGKSSLAGMLWSKNLCTIHPFCSTQKGMMRSVCDLPKTNGYLFCIPRCISEKNLAEVFAGVEKIPVLNSSVIWMFTYTLPKLNLLSTDRWKFWEIDSRYRLVPYGSRSRVVLPVGEANIEGNSLILEEKFNS
jgi:hypothetical protein